MSPLVTKLNPGASAANGEKGQFDTTEPGRAARSGPKRPGISKWPKSARTRQMGNPVIEAIIPSP